MITPHAAFTDAADSVEGDSLNTDTTSKKSKKTIIAIFTAVGLAVGMVSVHQTLMAKPALDPDLDANGYRILDAQVLFGRPTIAPQDSAPLRIIVDGAEILNGPR